MAAVLIAVRVAYLRLDIRFFPVNPHDENMMRKILSWVAIMTKEFALHICELCNFKILEDWGQLFKTIRSMALQPRFHGRDSD